MKEKSRKFFNLMLIATIVVMVILLKQSVDKKYEWYMVFLSLNFVYLLFKIVTSYFYQKYEGGTQAYSITAIVPFYNESVTSIKKMLVSLEKQTTVVNEIIFIDDGSHSKEGYDYLQQLQHHSLKIIVHRFEQNKGKKAALMWGIKHASGELILLSDSDSELDPRAVEELKKPFDNPKVGTVCGQIRVRNYKHSFLTKMQRFIYFNAFEVGRASQSLFNHIVVASGALSMHRKKVFDDHSLKVLEKSKFMGINCNTGDDRLLTDITNQKNYLSIYQSSAICYTDVPEKATKYFKQQVRWLKSGYLQSLYSVRHCWKKPFLLIYQLLESYLWLMNLGITLIFVDVTNFLLSQQLIFIWMSYHILVALIGSMRIKTLGIVNYFVSIIYSLVYGVILVGLRIYSLLTIWKTGWNTR
ncbi:glycosyltransferase [Enterococcus villorum]|uniref:Hyaluronan synthase n=2 Tax=Enterococcus villorum TaxID=112904 RepID=A0A511J2A4_9ENTE|nr:glycosyltransferase [Enterococcus villorum]EOH92561.1 hypothetical protein UAO_00447 [Enterococcus villorum ATCC 700913]EOW75664.1 hypothetical protein I591_02757 [Enterococcus villorum ATCC 700913]GEL92084.1 hypothetical protein EVI01_14210 [Enterococcus villorum]